MISDELVIGIDLGTSNSCVATVISGVPQILADSQGNSIVPSIVAFTPKGEVVGEDARQYLITDPLNTIYSFKRIMGCRFDDPGVRTAISGYPYHIVEGPNRSVVIQVRDEKYSVPEIAARILKKLKKIAEGKLKRTVKKAVCAVPSAFNDSQRAATRIAGRIAGLDIINVINEPTAAALAFGYDKQDARLLGIYDFGGGTFDFTILEMENQIFRVVATEGDLFLGGDDLDRAIALTAAEVFRQDTGRNLWREVAEWQRLLFECEAAKRRLTKEQQTVVHVKSIARTNKGVQDLVFPISRKIFIKICREFLERSFYTSAKACKKAGVTAKDLDTVLLVGGTTYINAVRTSVAQFFGTNPDISVDPTLAVAYGAAIQGATIMGQISSNLGPKSLIEMTTTSLAICTGGTLHIIIGANEQLPAHGTRTLTTSSDNQTEIRLSVFHGRGNKPKNWGYLGDIIIEKIPPAPAGKTTIAVTLTVNEQNRVSVTALNRATGKVIDCRLGADHTPTAGKHCSSERS